MNKAEYIKELDKRLKYIPKEDRQDAIEYYTELMSDMGVDESEDVAARLGSPKEVAKKILDECTQKHVKAYEENKTAKGRATVVWLSILGVLSLPVSLPLAIAVFAIAFAIIVSLIAIYLSLVVTAIALVVEGLVSLVVMWLAPGVAEMMVVLGMGLTSLALGVLLGFAMFYLGRFTIRKIFRRGDKEAIA